MMELKDLRGVVITLVMIGLVLGVGFMILREFTGIMSTTSGININETIEFSKIMARTYVGHNKTNMGCFEDFTLTSMYNATGLSILINPANYTYDANGKIWNITALPEAEIADWADGSVVVSYTYSFSNSTACAGMEETINATEKIQEWLGIIVVLLIVGIVLVIVFKFSGGGMPKMGGGEGFKPGKLKGFGGSGGDSGSAEI